MRWLAPLTRPLLRTKLESAPPATQPPAAGIDYLVAQAIRNHTAEPDPATEPAPIPWHALNERAEQAQLAADWAMAESHWRAMRLAYPEIFHAYTGGATALFNLGRPSDAQSLLTEAAGRFPWERAIPIEAGRIAMASADWRAAEAHWRRALTFDVRPWWVYTELAGALEHQDRLADAQAVLLEARDGAAEPNEITLFLYPARLATKREQWRLAAEHWAEACRRFPDRPELRDRLYEARMRLYENDHVAYERMEREERAVAPLSLGFDSLGGTGPDGGREFGCWHRAHDTEPLGLFRWATVPIASLITCLNRRFHGFGDPAAISLAEHEGEWQITDLAYGTKMPSFIPTQEVQLGAMMTQASRRMRCLAAKLIDDLTTPRKVFVLKSGWKPVTPEEIAGLSDAMRSYGPGLLLCVCAADADHAAGHVALRAPNVFVGRIDFSVRNATDQRHPVWCSLLDQVRQRLASPEITAMQADAEHIACLREAARTAQDQGNWQTALQRWQHLRDTFPDRPDGYEGVVRSLRALDQVQQGALTLMQALKHVGEHPGLLLELARYTMLIEWPEQALNLYADIRSRFPHIIEATTEAEAIMRHDATTTAHTLGQS